jgi:hypothetical protein
MGFEDIEKLRKNREIKTTHNNGYNSALLPNFKQKQLTRFRLISTLDYSVFGGVILLVALFNHLFRGGGPPIPILVLIVSATALGLYGSKKAID